MYSNTISLPDAVPGKTYMIKDVHSNNIPSKKLHAHGFIPGAAVKLLFSSPSGDPCAYEILGTVVALRFTDSSLIRIIPADL